MRLFKEIVNDILGNVGMEFLLFFYANITNRLICICNVIMKLG